MDLATAKGASAWHSTLLSSEYGFTLHKSVFHDAVALHYGWPLSRTPSHCACGNNFLLNTLYPAPKVVCHLYATMRSETCLLCHQVHVEPELQPVSAPQSFSLSTANIQDGARLDIAMNGFWGGRFEYCYVDVRSFNPYAPSNANSISSAYRHHENIVHMANKFVRLNTLLSQHWSFLPQGVWLQRRPPFTSDLPLFLLPNGVMNIVWLLDGYAVVFPSLCFTQPLLASVELGLHLDIFLPLNLHWISCGWSLR